MARTERNAPMPPMSECGASLVEYALLVALIALVTFAAFQFFGRSVDESLSRSGSELFPFIHPVHVIHLL